jgi:hypothetical protein
MSLASRHRGSSTGRDGRGRENYDRPDISFALGQRASPLSRPSSLQGRPVGDQGAEASPDGGTKEITVYAP